MSFPTVFSHDFEQKPTGYSSKIQLLRSKAKLFKSQKAHQSCEFANFSHLIIQMLEHEREARACDDKEHIIRTFSASDFCFSYSSLFWRAIMLSWRLKLDKNKQVFKEAENEQQLSN